MQRIYIWDNTGDPEDSEVLSLNMALLILYGNSTWEDGDINLSSSQIQNYSQLTAGSGTMSDDGGAQPSTLFNMAGGSIKMIGEDRFILGPPALDFDVQVSTAGNVSLNGRTVQFSKTLTQTGGVVDLHTGVLDLATKPGQDTNLYNLNDGTLVSRQPSFDG